MFSEEVTTASWSFFTWKSIHNIAAGDTEIVKALNENALSWRIIQHSLQSTFLITLGRMFDSDARSLTAHSLLDLCIKNLDQFGEDSLRDRKLRDQNGNVPDWLESYLEGTYRPTENNFKDLKAEVTKFKDIYLGNYQPIRHKLLAHKDMVTFEKRHELFERTDIGQIEDMLEFLFQIENIVWELLMNGRMTKVGDFDFSEAKRVDDDVGSLLEKLKS